MYDLHKQVHYRNVYMNLTKPDGPHIIGSAWPNRELADGSQIATSMLYRIKVYPKPTPLKPPRDWDVGRRVPTKDAALVLAFVVVLVALAISLMVGC